MVAIFYPEEKVTGPLHGSQTLSLLPEKDKKSEINYLTHIETISKEWLPNSEGEHYPNEVNSKCDNIQTDVEKGVVIEDRAGLGLDISGDSIPKEVNERLKQIKSPD